MKEVFVQLVTAGSRTAFKHPIPALIQVADALYGPTLIAHLQIAVYDQCKSQVGHADVNELYICHPGSVIGSYLDPTGLLQDGMYIAEIPAVPEPGVITSMVRETLLLRWAAAGARSQLVYASGGQVALLTAHMLENTGAGRPGGGPLTLFCRQQFIQQCSDMNRHSIENEAIQWIVGPPGIGKSCAALAFAHTLDPASWDVLWLSFSPEREAFMCVWLRGGDKVTCVIDLTDLQLLAQVLNATSPTKHTVLFLDGYATSPYEMENARLRCKKWHYEDKALHRLIYICSMAGVSKKYRRERYTVIRPSSEATGQHSRDVDMKYTDVTKLPDAAMKPATPSETELRDAGMKSSVSSVAETGRDEEVMSEMLCRLESWRFSDYQSAIRCDAFYHSVSDKFEGLNALANPAEEKARVLEQKYCIAGGSARLMFEVSSAKAFAALNDVIAEISNTDLMSQASSRALSPCAINRLQAGYYRPDNEYETCFIYAAECH
ncbi:hypothetical protein GN244_ATG09030 [Phytophthora infestans]|uniref:Crinkler (CRN) family protein n=1 Tax=Phytophthora infestans TaxID=4787 RepID=A0A833SUA3_PHYIN|nr:hypothetical protein GN244_ATG09030 [Phytophthora infestans]KAF4132535.1 hypothetical protein GN958_ATG18265 [Phytophthora infestans]